jgi:hypothetical protein
MKHRLRRVMPSLELPHWLMIAGTLLVVAGFIGVRVSGNIRPLFEQTRMGTAAG